MFAAATTNLPPTLTLGTGSRLRSPSLRSPSDLRESTVTLASSPPKQQRRRQSSVYAFAVKFRRVPLPAGVDLTKARRTSLTGDQNRTAATTGRRQFTAQRAYRKIKDLYPEHVEVSVDQLGEGCDRDASSSGWKIASMGWANKRAMRKASGKLGS